MFYFVGLFENINTGLTHMVQLLVFKLQIGIE